MRIWRLLLFVFYWLVVVATCPERCICKWKNGKQNVECVGKRYNSIPQNIDPGTQVFDFSENYLMFLPNNTFEALGLINLQKVYLSRCKLNKISDQAFRGLKNLVELDLSQNMLTHVPTQIFADFSSLMRLSLSENPIKVIQKHAFRHLPFLTTLEMSNCEVVLIEDESFIGLNHLEWLKLDNNKLTTIKGAQILPETLHGIDLHDNKWQCDCHLRDLHDWISNYNIPHLSEPICHSPKRLSGKPIKTLNEVDLACLLDVLPSKLYLEINEGKNISFQCIVNAIPEANITWWFEGQHLQSDTFISHSAQTYRIEESGGFLKKSELFIFNINAENNGTYECVGENPAGKSQANYTIIVTVEEEPIVIEVKFPFEYIIALVSGGGAMLLIITIIIILAIIKCKCNSKTDGKDKRRTNVVENNSKATFASCLSIAPGKMDGNQMTSDPTQHVLFCQINTNHELALSNMGNNFYLRPGINTNYHNENNPDIINHGDNKDRCKTCGQDCHKEECSNAAVNFEMGPVQVLPSVPHRQVKWIDQQNCNGTQTYSQEIPNDGQLITTDPHNKSFHDIDGYPLDYGLPKIETAQRSLMLSKGNSVFYRTLPHKSTLKKSGVSRNGFSHEAEMYNGPKPTLSYNIHNPLEKRYTMEGYPFVQPKSQPSFDTPQRIQIPSVDFITSEQQLLPSPSGYRCNDLTSPTMPNDFKLYVNQCINCTTFGQPKEVLLNNDNINTHTKCNPVSTRCVPTQTEPETNSKDKVDENMFGKIKRSGISTESADEGYVGDCVELKES